MTPRHLGRTYKYRTRPGYKIKDRYKLLERASVSAAAPLPTPHRSLLQKETPKGAPPPAIILPKRNYFKMKESGINRYWSEAFYKNLDLFVGNNSIYTDRNKGLIYHYLVDDQIRYVGQTKENSLKWRMNKQQTNGQRGYNLFIKRNLLQAASEGRLKIETKKIPRSQLDECEKTEIETYAPTNRLWNQDHNQHFKTENFYL